MALPTSRDQTIDSVSPIPSSLLNRLQDCIIGKKYPATWRSQTLTRGFSEANIGWTVPGGLFATANAASSSGIGVPGYDVGTRITGLRAYVKGTGAAGTINITLSVASLGGVIGLGVLSIINPPNAYAEYDLDPLTTIHTLADNEALYIDVTLPLANMVINNVAIKSDRL